MLYCGALHFVTSEEEDEVWPEPEQRSMSTLCRKGSTSFHLLYV